MKKYLRGFTPNLDQSSAIDLGEITNKKKCDNEIYVIFYFNCLMMLGVGRDYRLRKDS